MRAFALFLISFSAQAAEVRVYSNGEHRTFVGALDSIPEAVVALQELQNQNLNINEVVTPPELNANGQTFAALDPQTRSTDLRYKPVVEDQGTVETTQRSLYRITGWRTIQEPIYEHVQTIEEPAVGREMAR